MANRKNRGLNRGLEHLLGDFGQDVLEQAELETLRQIEVAHIQPGQYQPRKSFDEGALRELARSIAEHGILQPLVVRPIATDRYEIIAGERRFRAGQKAGLKQVPCVVKKYSDKQALAVALIENLQRSDLNALEVAHGLQQLVEDFTLTHERVAQLVGRSRSSVSNTLRLLELSDPVKKALAAGAIEMGHGRALLSLPAPQQQVLLEEITDLGLTVRQTEMKVRSLHRQETPAAVNTMKNSEISALENKLSTFMGHRIAITQKKKGNGKLVLKYRNLQELDAILEKWGYKSP